MLRYAMSRLGWALVASRPRSRHWAPARAQRTRSSSSHDRLSLKGSANSQLRADIQRFEKYQRCPARPALAVRSGAEDQRIAASGLVDYVDRNPEIDKDLPQPPDVVTHLFGEQGRVGPSLSEDLGGGEVPMGMAQQELKQLELALGQ